MEEKSIIRIYGWRLSTMYRNSPYSSKKSEMRKRGEITTRMVSVIEQVAELPTIYKPVDAIDESKQNTDKEGYVVRIVPYDAGDRISFRYIEVPDFQKVAHEIERSKEVLASSDYKIIKCYEAP